MDYLQYVWSLFSASGVNPAQLAREVVNALIKKAGTGFLEKLEGSSLAAGHWLKNVFRDHKERAQFIGEIQRAKTDTERDRIFKTYLSSWLTGKGRAEEISSILYRAVLLKALRGYCKDLPNIAGYDFPVSLSNILVAQHFSIRSRNSEHGHGDQPSNRVFSGLWPLMRDKGIRRVLLTGDAGLGKSTQARKLILQLIDTILLTTEIEEYLDSPFPVILEARDLTENTGSMADVLSKAVARNLGAALPFSLPEGFFELRHPGMPSSLLIVIDGMDELEVPERWRVTQQLNSAYGNAENIYLVATMRRVEYQQEERWPNFKEVELLPLNRKQSVTLAAKILRQDESSKYLVDEVLGGPRPKPGNPLLITLAALLRREGIAASGIELFQSFSLSLLAKRHNSQKMLFGPERALKLLRKFAIQPDQRQIVDETISLAVEGNAWAYANSWEGKNRAVEQLLSTGLVVRAGQGCRFIHESFKDYFRAEELASTILPMSYGTWRAIDPNVWGWDTVPFIVELWNLNRQQIDAPLRELLEYGPSGFRALSIILSRITTVPHEVLKVFVERCLDYEDVWEPGLIQGPITQLAAASVHFQEAREALSQIAQNTFTYDDDAIEAAALIHRFGMTERAKSALLKVTKDANGDPTSRVRAAAAFGEISASEAISLLERIVAEWEHISPETELAEIEAAEAFHKFGCQEQALALLKSVSERDPDWLGQLWLARVYHQMGKDAKALTAAQKAAKDQELPHYDRAELASLLDQLGDASGATFVRQATDSHSDWGDSITWFNVSRDMLSRKGRSGSEVTELAANTSLSGQERVDILREILEQEGESKYVIEILLKLCAEEPRNANIWAEALVQLGATSRGCAVLFRSALEPANSAQSRTEAIEMLARMGRQSEVFPIFRKLVLTGELSEHDFAVGCKVFFYSSYRKKLQEVCASVFLDVNARTGLRLEALHFLTKAGWLKSRKRAAVNILRRIVSNKAESPENRKRAALRLSNIDEGYAGELLYEIAQDPVESLEAGLAAVEALLRLDDSFAAFDVGFDVVFDKKLGLDETIQAALVYLGMRFHDDELDDYINTVMDSVADELVRIAQNPLQPVDRRITAAGLGEKDPDVKRKLRTGIEALARDISLPDDLRCRAIVQLCSPNGSLNSDFKNLLSSPNLSDRARIRAIEAFQLSGLFDEAKTTARAVVADGQDDYAVLSAALHLVQFGETDELSGLIELFAERLPKSHCFGELDRLLSSLARRLPRERVLQFARALAGDTGVEISTAEVAVVFLMTRGDSVGALEATDSRIAAAEGSRRYDWESLGDLITLCQWKARLGGRQSAVQKLLGLVDGKKLSTAQQAFCCECLSVLGATTVARQRLKTMVTKSNPGDESFTAIGRAFAEVRDWAQARRLFAKAAKDESVPVEIRVEAIAQLGQLGSRELGFRLITDIGPNVLADPNLACGHKGSIIRAFSSLGQRELAVATAQKILENEAVDAFWKMEAIDTLGSIGLHEAALALLQPLLRTESPSEICRAAEILFDLGKPAQAHSLLSKLLEAHKLHPWAADDCLEIADSLSHIGWSYSARSLIEHLNSHDLELASFDRLVQLRRYLDEND